MVTTKLKTCRSCGAEFESVRSPNGRWRATCSVECRVQAMRRFAEALLARADELEAELDEEQPCA